MKQNYLGTYGVLKGSYMESRLKYYDFESKKKYTEIQLLQY